MSVDPQYLYAAGYGGGRFGDLGQPGLRVPMWNGLTMNGTVSLSSANRAYLCRFYTIRPMVIQSIAFIVTVAASLDDACDVGIYSSDAATRLVSKGSTTGLLNSTGLKVATITSTPLAGGTVYYGVFSSGTPAGTAATLFGVNLGNAAISTVFGTTPPNAELGHKDSGAFPLSGTLAPLSGTTSGPPALFLREF